MFYQDRDFVSCGHPFLRTLSRQIEDPSGQYLGLSRRRLAELRSSFAARFGPFVMHIGCFQYKNSRSPILIWDAPSDVTFTVTSKYGTCKTGTARFWPWLESFSVRKSLKDCKLFSQTLHLFAGVALPSLSLTHTISLSLSVSSAFSLSHTLAFKTYPESYITKDTYPESYATKYTNIRRYTLASAQNAALVRRGQRPT